MSLENNDFTPKHPHSGDDGNGDKPGYPPPGQKQKLAKIADKEAAQKGNPEAILSELEQTESLDARKIRLAKFVSNNFPECPPENIAAATKECILYEDDTREFLEEPDFRIAEEDIPDLKPKINKIATIDTNEQKVASKTEKKDTKDQVIVREEAGDRQDKVIIQSVEAKTPKLKKDANSAEAKESETKSDQILVKENYPEPLKSEKGGSIGAIEALMGMVKSPKVRARLNRILGVFGALQNTIPGKSKITTRLLNASNLNLGDGSITSVFAHFTTSVDHSSEYTKEEKAKIHATLKGEATIGFNATVSDMDRNLGKTRKIYDQETGKIIGEEPAFEGEEHGLEVRDGVIVYTEHGEKYMKNLNTGDVAYLAANAGSVGHTRSILNYWGGQTPLLDKGVEVIWGWNLKNQRIPKPSQLENFEHYQQLLEGGSRGLSPEVQGDLEQINFGRKYLFISQNGNTSPFASNQDQMDKSLANLGVEIDGSMKICNEEILKEIGNYLNQKTYSSGQGAYNALQQHLHEQFPDDVDAPQSEKTSHK